MVHSEGFKNTRHLELDGTEVSVCVLGHITYPFWGSVSSSGKWG